VPCLACRRASRINRSAPSRSDPIGPFAYGEDDVILATRIADHVALALAHEQLAEEGRRAAQAQERANLLEQRVHTLVEELERRGGHRALGESAPWKQALVHATKVAKTDTTVLITGESGPQPHPSFIGVFCPAALSERDRAVAGTGQSDERMS
jgi:hypothetical protein